MYLFTELSFSTSEHIPQLNFYKMSNDFNVFEFELHIFTHI